jgi:divalent metal cation (Fe/Co/Zn/Cd) transporter
VLDEVEVRRVVMNVPEVVGCHQIRTRGSLDHTFLDLHVWFRADTTLYEAHRLSHVVKDRLLERFPQIADAIIHIEPPPAVQPDGER